MLGALLQPEAEQAHPGLQAALEAVPARAGYEAPLDSPISLLSLLPPPRGDDGRRPYATYAGARTSAAAHAGGEHTDPQGICQLGFRLQFM